MNHRLRDPQRSPKIGLGTSGTTPSKAVAPCSTVSPIPAHPVRLALRKPRDANLALRPSEEVLPANPLLPVMQFWTLPASGLRRLLASQRRATSTSLMI